MGVKKVTQRSGWAHAAGPRDTASVPPMQPQLAAEHRSPRSLRGVICPVTRPWPFLAAQQGGGTWALPRCQELFLERESPVLAAMRKRLCALKAVAVSRAASPEASRPAAQVLFNRAGLAEAGTQKLLCPRAGASAWWLAHPGGSLSLVTTLPAGHGARLGNHDDSPQLP